MNAKEIVRRWLNRNGYDGLYCRECGCHVSDLMPCDESCARCSAGYARIAADGEPVICSRKHKSRDKANDMWLRMVGQNR